MNTSCISVIITLLLAISLYGKQMEVQARSTGASGSDNRLTASGGRISSSSVDLADDKMMFEIDDLLQKLKRSIYILNDLLKEITVDNVSDKEHVEKMLDYMHFRQQLLSSESLPRSVYDKLKSGINRDFEALPAKVKYILSHPRNLQRGTLGGLIR